MSKKPEDYNLPTDYTHAENSWGKSFYKIYTEKKNYGDAKAQCESDGTFLAVPRSEAENDFIAGLIPNENIWIGINDIEREGRFVSVNGRDISYTKWYAGEPNNMNHGAYDEDGVEMRQAGSYKKTWNDDPASWTKKFICSVDIAGLFQIFILMIYQGYVIVTCRLYDIGIAPNLCYKLCIGYVTGVN